MNWLFIHQSFPGQFTHIARRLAEAGHTVVSISQLPARAIPKGRALGYRPRRPAASLPALHQELQRAIDNGEAVASLAEQLKRTGFDPHLVIGHTGWGEVLFVKDIWPTRPLLGYFEFHHRPLVFDAEYPPTAVDVARHRVNDAVDTMTLGVVDSGLTPTAFQRSTYPKPYWNQLVVAHEGIDTHRFRPEPQTRIRLGDRLVVPGDEIVTYCARSLEPHRGFHLFMRAVPQILKRRPNAHVLIVGRGRHCYSAPPATHRSYAEQLMAEIAGSVDPSRIHFLGHLPSTHYRAVLRVSAVHVYLTYPFVLSWSLLEAMSTRCLVVGSRTPPVEEMITDGENGLLVDFFDGAALADRICDVLSHPDRYDSLRAAARQSVIDRCDLEKVCLPAHLRLYGRLTGHRLHSCRVNGTRSAGARSTHIAYSPITHCSSKTTEMTP
jgi:glycosyltransferase involved in cell wall biosynthesis